jgi:hypothetical protein
VDIASTRALGPRTRRYEIVVLPLAGDNAEVSMILIGMKYID